MFSPAGVIVKPRITGVPFFAGASQRINHTPQSRSHGGATGEATETLWEPINKHCFAQVSRGIRVSPRGSTRSLKAWGGEL